VFLLAAVFVVDADGRAFLQFAHTSQGLIYEYDTRARLRRTQALGPQMWVNTAGHRIVSSASFAK
jgi:hypothetical protein